mmetsp:Transcript_20937/g.35307  ORF Transcript_20937/g.35307 Transcript_20937/m.35307 type:complete len:160 (+) Transcript_20937:1749-2228(+)
MVTRLSNSEFIADLVKLLRHTHDLPQLLLRIKKVNAGHADWLKLYQTIDHALPIIDHIYCFTQQYCQSTESPSLFESSDKKFLETLLVNLNVQVIRNLKRTLHSAIDVPSTKECKQVTICGGYDEVGLATFRDSCPNCRHATLAVWSDSIIHIVLHMHC